MVTWGQFIEEAPELAEVGRRLFDQHRLAYLATVRKYGDPRLHPVTPVDTGTGLYVAVNHRSPKRWDLERDRRYSLHAPLGKRDEEFVVTGEVGRVTDGETRDAIAAAASHTIHDTDWLFEFHIAHCLQGYWENVGQPDTYPVRQQWRAE